MILEEEKVFLEAKLSSATSHADREISNKYHIVHETLPDGRQGDLIGVLW